MPEIITEIPVGDMEQKHLNSSVHRVVSRSNQSLKSKSTISTPQRLSGAGLVEQRAPDLLKRWTLDNVITLTSDHRMIRAI